MNTNEKFIASKETHQVAVGVFRVLLILFYLPLIPLLVVGVLSGTAVMIVIGILALIVLWLISKIVWSSLETKINYQMNVNGSLLNINFGNRMTITLDGQIISHSTEIIKLKLAPDKVKNTLTLHQGFMNAAIIAKHSFVIDDKVVELFVFDVQVDDVAMFCGDTLLASRDTVYRDAVDMVFGNNFANDADSNLDMNDFESTANEENNWKIICRSGSLEGQSWDVSDKVIIGTNAAVCNIVLDSSSVSKIHCEVGVRGGAAYIKDMGSNGGTFVGDYKIEAFKVMEFTSNVFFTVGENNLFELSK